MQKDYGKTIKDFKTETILKDIEVYKKSIKLERILKYALLGTTALVCIKHLNDYTLGTMFDIDFDNLQVSIQDKINLFSDNLLEEINQDLSKVIVRVASIIAPLFVAFRFKKAIYNDKKQLLVLTGNYKQKGMGFVRERIHSFVSKKYQKNLDKAKQSFLKNDEKIETQKVNNQSNGNATKNENIFADENQTNKPELNKTNENTSRINAGINTNEKSVNETSIQENTSTDTQDINVPAKNMKVLFELTEENINPESEKINNDNENISISNESNLNNESTLNKVINAKDTKNKNNTFKYLSLDDDNIPDLDEIEKV